METKIFNFRNHFATVSEGELMAISDSEAVVLCAKYPVSSTAVIFRENDEETPQAVRAATRVRTVNLAHGDLDPIRPLVDKELSGIVPQVISWLSECGCEAQSLKKYL